ncbi:MAG: DinB family protein [Bryobacteraceae bacterium]
MTRFTMFLLAAPLFALAQTPSTPAKSFAASFEDINRRLLDMAKEFPEAKYGYRATKDVRSFGEIIVHVSSGNAYAAKAGRGEKANWDEIDPKGYATKAAAVALLEKTIADATATLKATPEDRWAKTVEPWLAVIEHAGEHYGQLVVYYRNNGLVPPESRPKK